MTAFETQPQQNNQEDLSHSSKETVEASQAMLERINNGYRQILGKAAQEGLRSGEVADQLIDDWATNKLPRVVAGHQARDGSLRLFTLHGEITETIKEEILDNELLDVAMPNSENPDPAGHVLLNDMFLDETDFMGEPADPSDFHIKPVRLPAVAGNELHPAAKVIPKLEALNALLDGNATPQQEA
jgi:hypothetical protein